MAAGPPTGAGRACACASVSHASNSTVRFRYFDGSGQPVKALGFHNLRHSLGSWLVSNGVDIKTVSSMLRRSNVRTTLAIYTHAVDANKLAAQLILSYTPLV